VSVTGIDDTSELVQPADRSEPDPGGDRGLWGLMRHDLSFERVRLLMQRALGNDGGAQSLVLVEAALRRLPPGRLERLARRCPVGC
jgi:hypothetical protein